ncbi:GNAT family N-acetyltransferase [Clostridium sp.]|uniref:GNAT family N-acetyltransferase n=1 Tax=Clostridium sp. TaxID=1506 RepID=UPI002FCB5D12
MKNNKIENAATFYELKWDTDYFGVNCAKAILYKSLTLVEWNNLKDRFKDFQFISIENRNSEPVNAQFIGKDTNAFLADVNIQFKKKLEVQYKIMENISFHQAMKRDEHVVEIAEFQFSKFTEDPELAMRGGNQVYCQWLINSFEKLGKYYALSKNENGEVNGFLLHSYSDNACVVELIAVSKNSAYGGIGKNLFKALECVAYERGCNEIRVGTQVRNLGAINFYHKVGCKQVGCHQIYHLWNL